MLSGKRIPRKQLIFFSFLLLLIAGLALSVWLKTSDSRKFKRLSEELFFSSLSGNTLNLHYTLAYPENYGFPDTVTLSSYDPDEENGEADIRAALNTLSQISPKHLKDEDAYAYRLLERYLNLRLEGESYAYYSEPLSPSSGMQSGLPILLADYAFRSAKDVEDYLQLLDQTDSYFEGLLQYEKEKAEAGLFMSDLSARKIIEQCDAIMDKDSLSSGSHFLHTTFEERLNAMEAAGTITREQKNKWMWENDRLLTTVMLPAYEEAADTFTILKGSGRNDMGLYYFPEGRSYYQYLLASTTGSSRSVPEIKALLFEDFQENLAAMAALRMQYPELSLMTFDAAYAFPYSDPEEMLEDLRDRMKGDFPDFPESRENITPSCKIKSVSPTMEDYCSPAYYLTPPIDDISSNIIYINHKNSPDALSLYTTLAHEGYPGHLYQTVYSQLYMNRTDTPLVRHILHYGGYVEGWALYVENLSYHYARSLVQSTAPLDAAWYELCRLGRNVQLCLYSLLDIAIHYDGATFPQIQAILAKIGVTDPQTAAAIYQYIVEEPVTYLKYYLGFLEFSALKERAQELWGSDFSLSKFHQFILETGPSDFQNLTWKLKRTKSPSP